MSDKKQEDTVEVISIPQAEPRKATDVLLSIEEKLSNLIKLLTVSNMNSNLTIARMNALGTKVDEVHSYTEGLKKEYNQAPGLQLEPSIISSPPPEEAIKVSAGHIVNNRRKPAEETEYFKDHSSNEVSAPVVPQNNSSRKIPVQQRITSAETGKDIFMAEVLISDEDGAVINKARTNAVGKWQAHLPPGTYSVSITKTDTKTKQEIKSLQKITVIDSGSTVILPVAMIGSRQSGQQIPQQKSK